MSDEQTNEQTEAQEADHIRSLREKAKKADMVPDLERKVAVLEAGINTSTPLGQMFLKSYDGELTSEAIQQAAAAVGLIQGQPDPDPKPGEPGTAEAEYLDTRRTLDRGAVAPNEVPEVNAADKAYKVYDDTRKQGKRTEDARVDAFAAFIAEAAQGNPTALFSDADWATKLRYEGSSQA